MILATTACSTTATIYQRDGMMMEGTIKGGSDEDIIVQPVYGPQRTVKRVDIADIDHPGNVHTIIGGITLGYGFLFVASTLPECRTSESGQGTACLGAFIPAGIGVGLLAWGLVTWLGSKNSADDTSLEPPLPRLPPPALPPPSAAPPAAAPPAPAGAVAPAAPTAVETALPPPPPAPGTAPQPAQPPPAPPAAAPPAPPPAAAPPAPAPAPAVPPPAPVVPGPTR